MNDRKTGGLMTKNIFKREVQFLDHAQDVIDSGCTDPAVWQSEYEHLFGQYQKLMNQTNKLIRMGDMTQKNLMEAHELVSQKVEQLTRAEEQLRELSITDALTGLANRRGAYQRLDDLEVRYRRNQQPFSIFLIDIDFFKRVNDSFGHGAGDKVLVNLASVMRNSLREQDFIGRWGGEEFILILPDTDLHGAVVLAEKLRTLVEQQQMKVEEHDIRVTISLGGSQYSLEAGLIQCLEQADTALYSSKTKGRNRVEIHEF